jgi:hypothetical protein
VLHSLLRFFAALLLAFSKTGDEVPERESCGNHTVCCNMQTACTPTEANLPVFVGIKHYLQALYTPLLFGDVVDGFLS